jgi:Zn-dependent protease
MNWSVRLFRISGISVELHLTFLLFALLILITGGLDSLMFLFLVFTIVLAHEFIHSMTAVAHGINVPRITLTPIGGLASIDLPEDPMLELKVSIVGPLFNFLLAIFSIFILYALNPAVLDVGQLSTDNMMNIMQSDSLTGILLMMVSINLTLGAFNMLPAFPMDGGRVFRSVLALWMDYEKATRVASSVGQVIFLALALIGIVDGNLWLVLIGLFLSYSGGNEVKYVNLRRLLGQATLSDIAEDRFSYVNSSLTWGEFASTVFRRGRSIYLIVDSLGSLRGVLDLSTLVGIDPNKTVGNYRTTEYVVLDGGTKVVDSLKHLFSRRIVLVSSADKIVGYITAETLSDSAPYLIIKRSSK